MLLLGTVFWGAGFTWAKASIECANRAAGLPHGALFGPLFTLGVRFGLGALVWFLLFPQARRGWNLTSAARATGLGLLLAAGLIVQHLGLDRTSEAVSAFLTSLTILFVPILVTLTARRPPPGVLWLGVVIAVAGVWMMTGAQPSGFGIGEIFGLACSLAFAIYILAVNAVVPRDTPWRMTGGQFLVVAVICIVWAFVSLAPSPGAPGEASGIGDRPRAGGGEGPAQSPSEKTLTPALSRSTGRGGKVIGVPSALHIPGHGNWLQVHTAWRVILAPDVTLNVLLLTVFATIGAFGLLTHFQPFVEPTRAALIYLFEPVVATVWAAIAAGHGLGRTAVIGASLILIANVLVEFLSIGAADSSAGDRKTAG